MGARKRSAEGRGAPPASGVIAQVSGAGGSGANAVFATAPWPEKRVFDDWEEAVKYIEEYFTRTFQVFRKRSSTSVVGHNVSVKKKNTDENSAYELIPEDIPLKTYNRLWVCTHHGKHEPVTNGDRKRSKYRATDCKASVAACIRRQEGVYKVVITDAKTVHNHPLSEARFDNYPNNRLQLSESHVERVELLRSIGLKPKVIMKYIVQQTKSKPTLYDVHNLIAKLKAESTKGTTVASRTKQWVEEFTQEPGNIARVFFDEDKIATCVTIQSAFMRKIFRRFPEVVMIDATHDTNEQRYKLFSFMVVDAFGSSQYVQHSLVENERKETLETVVQQFKDANPDWEKIKCIIIDKDFTELAVLRVMFPDVRILLCQFHAVKYLTEQLAKYDFSPAHKELLAGAISLLIKSRNQEEYNKHWSLIQHVAQESSAQATESREDEEADPEHPFITYFKKNWSTCVEMWCSTGRQDILTLGTDTNNRLEASWKQVKDLVDRLTPLDECIVGVMFYQTIAEISYNNAADPVTQTYDPGCDEELTNFAATMTDYATDVVKSQYNLAKTYQYFYYPVGVEHYYIKAVDRPDDETRAEYVVDKFKWQCNCPFMSVMALPCRHIFYIRRDKNFENVIPPTRFLHRRWQRVYAKEDVALDEDSIPAFAVRPAQRRVVAAKTRQEKYKMAAQVSTRIADVMAELGTKQFKQALAVLERVEVIFRSDKWKQLERLTEHELILVPEDSSSPSDIPDSPGDIPDSRDISDSPGDIPDNPDSRIDSGSAFDDESVSVSDDEYVPSADADDDDDAEEEEEWTLPNPPSRRGKAKTVVRRITKQKRSQKAKAASLAFSSGTTFASATIALRGTLTIQIVEYTSSFISVDQRPIQEYKTPVASKAQAKKPVISESTLFTIFPDPVLAKASKAITAFQGKAQKAGKPVAETSIVVTFPGVGTFAATTIRAMQQWKRAVNSSLVLRNCIKWMNAPFEPVNGCPDWMQTPPPSDVALEVEKLHVLSKKAGIVGSLSGKNYLNEDALLSVVEYFVGHTTRSVAVRFIIKTQPADILGNFEKAPTQFTVFLVCLQAIPHWCAIVVDDAGKEIICFDPSRNYQDDIDKIAAANVRPSFGRNFCIRQFDDFPAQQDSYNCGVYVLLFVEQVLLRRHIPTITKALLAYTRFRYISMCIE